MMFSVLLAFIANLNESMSFFDKVIVSVQVVGYKDITSSLVLLTIGILLLLALRSSKRISDLLNPGLKKYSGTQDTSPDKTYDKLNIESIETIVSKISINYRILITIYGVLLAFVVSNTMSFAFSNWAVIIWTGWILAIIVRTGTIALKLSDIIEISPKKNKTQIKKISRTVHASKTFAKHALVVLILAIAFLPAIYVNPQSEFDQEKFPWDPQVTIFSIGIGIIGVALFVYLFVMRFSEFQTYKGPQGLWLATIILILIGIVPNIYNSPLEPIPVMTYDGSTFMIPQIIDVVLVVGLFFGVIMIIMYVVGLTYDTERIKRFFKRKNSN